MPYYWLYPERLRAGLLKRWKEKLPAWSEMIATTRVLTRRRMQELFPGSRVFVEISVGFPKSYTAYFASSGDPPRRVDGREAANQLPLVP